jgi:hypothetical protein
VVILARKLCIWRSRPGAKRSRAARNDAAEPGEARPDYARRLGRGNPASGRAALASAGAVLAGADGVIGELGRIPAPDEHAPGAVTLAVVPERPREAAIEQQYSRLELHRHAAVAAGGLDEIGRDPAPMELARDPFGAPLLELALVLREAHRVAGIVEEAGRSELLDGGLDRLRLDALALEARPELGDSALTARRRLVGEVDRPLGLRSRARTLPPSRQGYAAFSSGAAAAAGSAAPAAGVPVPFAAPSGSPAASTADSGAAAGSTPSTS